MAVGDNMVACFTKQSSLEEEREGGDIQGLHGYLACNTIQCSIVNSMCTTATIGSLERSL